MTQALPLLAGIGDAGATYGIMDKAYDANNILDYLESQNITPVIPPKISRKEQRDYDRDVYKERHLIEALL